MKIIVFALNICFLLILKYNIFILRYMILQCRNIITHNVGKVSDFIALLINLQGTTNKYLCIGT